MMNRKDTGSISSRTDIQDELENLRKFHPKLIDTAAEAEKGQKAAKEQVAKVKRQHRNRFYSNLLYALVHMRLEERVAKRVWQNIMRHKAEMGEKLGRNIRVSVAAIDYLQQIDLLGEIKIMPIEDYEERTISSVTDKLTGAYTFGYYEETMGTLVNRAHNDNAFMSLIVFDVDDFKHYNDRNGHQQGDEVLKKVVQVMQQGVRKADHVIRYGGEEFVIILYNANEDRAFEIGDKICRKIEKTKFENEEAQPLGKLTVSGGVATYPVVANDAIGLLFCADNSMYQAKRDGKNRVITCRNPIARDALIKLKEQKK